MKHLSIFLLICQLTTKAFAQTSFVNYQMGGTNSAAFTTNNFKSIGIGKSVSNGNGPLIWAGTQYGGLYHFNNDTWVKSDKLTNVLITDIKMDADSGVWISQAGTQSSGGAASNLAGGVNYFPGANDAIMKFYSVQGTTTDGFLVSRNARSLYIDQGYSQANGRLPRVWAAQGTYISGSATRRGGLSIGLNQSSPYFTTYNGGGYATGSNNLPISEAVGGNSEEVWVAARQNDVGNTASQILRYSASATGDTLGTYSATNTNLLLRAGFRGQAIHFDEAGNKWIGLFSGGLVIKTRNDNLPTDWVSMNDINLLPSGTQVNFNAITSDPYGNVYIGTSNGLLEYKSKEFNPGSSPDNPASYNRYTIDNGLPSNNITGVVYDKQRHKLLITTDAGVSFMNKLEPTIKGVVFDVSCDLDNEQRSIPGLQKKPLPGYTTARLLKNGVEEDFAVPDANGIFEFENANDDDTYTVEIKNVTDGRTMIYKYDNIKNHTALPITLMPHSLIGELEKLKSKLESKCIPVSLFFALADLKNLFCFEDIFDTDSYGLPSDHFYNPGGVTKDHTKRVENLANYYTALATIHKLGDNFIDVSNQVMPNLLDMLQTMGELVELNSELAKKANLTKTKGVFNSPNVDNVTRMTVKAFKDGMITILTLYKDVVVDPKAKKELGKVIAIVKEMLDALMDALEKGLKQGAAKALYDNLKKVVSAVFTGYMYKDWYAQNVHAGSVATAASNAFANNSDLKFESVYSDLYNPKESIPSLVNKTDERTKELKEYIETSRDASLVADYASKIADLVSEISTVINPAVAATAKAVAKATKVVKCGALGVAMVIAITGADEIADNSESILEKADLAKRPLASSSDNRGLLSVTLASPDSLVARKNRYNQRLTALNTVYAASAFDSAAYHNAYFPLQTEDSLYTDALFGAINTILATSDSASIYIPGFKDRIRYVIDTFVSHQYLLRNAHYFENIAYLLSENENLYKPGLDSLTTEIKLANDSAVNGLISLYNMVNAGNINAQANLVYERKLLNHTLVPGSAGSVTYYFKNYGGETQNNVSFKISKIGGGYTLTSADSVNVGSIAPGQTKSVTYNFVSPATDSVGHYEITVKADNGVYSDVWGSLFINDPTRFYTKQNGDWNKPETWEGNTVPGPANKVYIRHTVTITADATVKDVNIIYPGDVKVSTGKKLLIKR